MTNLGIVINLVLASAKAVIGLASGSMSLVADAIHSLSDTATDLVVLIGTHFGSKEPDLEHPYGHGRFETFATGFVALVLVAVGAFMIQKASVAIAMTQADSEIVADVGFWAIAIALVSVLAKEILYWLTRTVALATHSTVLLANAWHHRSDALSSIAVLVGLIATRFGFEHGDQIAAIIVGLMIILVGVKIIGGCIHEFTERAVDADTIEQIKSIIASDQRVTDWHKLRTRSVGREIFIDMHILVDPQMNIVEAHEVADSLECSMHEQIRRPVNIMLHLEPDMMQLSEP